MRSSRHLLLLFLLLLPAACAQKTTTAPFLVAHRGASEVAPENTLAAFQLAWDEGAAYIEGDFYLAADGRVVCIHDKTTGRTTTSDLPVAHTDSVTLRGLDVGTWKAPRWAGERIPYLREVLAAVPAGGHLLLEVKCGPEILPAIAAVLAGSPLRKEQVAIIAFDAAVIAAADDLLPEYAAYWLVEFTQEDDGWRPDPGAVLDRLEKIGAEGLGCNARLPVLTRGYIDELHARGLLLNVWTVNDAELATQLRARGADLITTDRPSALTVEIRG